MATSFGYAEKLAGRERDAAIARVAGRQHGVITTSQLNSIGILPSGISDRVAAGRLHRIHRGVYAVGHRALGNEVKWMAAVLACGEGAVLSHRSAAALWRIASAQPGAVDVTVPGDGGRSQRSGIRLHRSKTLLPEEFTRRHGIPVTRPGRTLDDLQRVLTGPGFAAALREAEFLRLPIGRRETVDRARTDLEALFLTLCRRLRRPQPEVNVSVDEFEVDFLWRDQHLIVEVDGWESHRTRSAFEADRARDAQLKLLGYDVLRFTWRQLEDERATVMRTIRSILNARPMLDT